MSRNEVKTKDQLINDVRQIVSKTVSRDDTLQKVCELLAGEVEVFDWVGFYLVDEQAERELVLGPYVGEPTEHTRIPFGKGICGQAADTHETFVVQDVSEAGNYLSCSIHVKAEIVVPVMKEGRFIAELDIDSHTKNSITGEYREMLEEMCAILAKIF